MTARGKAALFVCLVTCAAFANSFSGRFVFDDIHEIERNAMLERLLPPWPAMFIGNRLPARPLPYLSFAIDRRLWGIEPFGFHLTNLVIHVVSALALFELARLTLLSPRLEGRWGVRSVAVAATIAAIWAVHPLQTQSVTYVYQRIESLHGMFFLLAMAAFARAAAAGWQGRWLGWSVAATAAAMASKETAVVLPLLILAWDWCFAAAGRPADIWSRRRWYALLAATWTILGLHIVAQGTKFLEFRRSTRSPLEYAITQPGVILHYVRLAFWPVGQQLEYSGWPAARLPAALPAATIVLTAAAAAVVGTVRGHPLAWLGAAFFLTLAPTSSILPIDALANEQRMYLPLAALVAACVVGAVTAVDRITKLLGTTESVRRQALAALSGGVVLALMTTTWTRNRDYESVEGMWRDVLAKDPDSYRAHWAIAALRDEAGETDVALAHAIRTLELKPSSRVLLDMAGRRQAAGDAAGAEALCRRCLEMQRLSLPTDDPDLLTTAGDLAVAIYLQGRLDEAAAVCREYLPAMERVRGPDDPTTVAALVILAEAAARAGDPVAAERLAREAFARATRPDQPFQTMATNAAGVLATILEQNERLDEAVAIRRRLAADAERTLGPGHPRSQAAATKLAMTMAAQCTANGDHAGAARLHRILIEAFTRSLGVDHPDTVAARKRLEAAEAALQQRR